MKRILIGAWLVCVLNVAVLYGQQGVSIDSLALSATDPVAGSTSIYTVSFSSSQDLSATASVVLEFPVEFDLSGVLLAGSNTVNGGLATQVSGNTLSLTRKGGGAILLRNQAYSLSFGNIKNPLPGNYSVQISVWQSAPGSARDSAKTVLVSIFAPGS